MELQRISQAAEFREELTPHRLVLRVADESTLYICAKHMPGVTPADCTCERLCACRPLCECQNHVFSGWCLLGPAWLASRRCLWMEERNGRVPLPEGNFIVLSTKIWRALWVKAFELAICKKIFTKSNRKYLLPFKFAPACMIYSASVSILW